jgi:putative membrane protein
MLLAANIVIAFIAILHVYILVLEMFLWDTPKGHKAFNLTPKLAADTKVLAANQGLYNGFLAAGLFWGLYLGNAGNPIKFFFLLCILVAGMYGAATSSKKILYIQVIPSLIGLALLYLAVN